jgi:hypothetical protein
MLMIAKLKGAPLISTEGERQISMKTELGLPESVSRKPAIRNVPTMSVLKHVSMNMMRFTHGNFSGEGLRRTGAPSAVAPAGWLKLLSMNPGLTRLQVLAGLEPNSFSGRDVHFGASSRIPSDTRFPRFYREDAKAAQLNPIVGLQSVLHTVENRVHRLFCFRFADARAFDDLINEIEFYHFAPPMNYDVLAISFVNIFLPSREAGGNGN